MFRRISIITLVLALALVLTVPAFANPGKPGFAPGVYGDGRAWGTKGAAALPPPNGSNLQSYDRLFVFTNGSEGQLPIAEAAPGNPRYNGGRWFTQTVSWTAAGIADHGGNPPVLKSYAEVAFHAGLGHLTIAAGSPAGGPPDFFECPLLPVK